MKNEGLLLIAIVLLGACSKTPGTQKSEQIEKAKGVNNANLVPKETSEEQVVDLLSKVPKLALVDGTGLSVQTLTVSSTDIKGQSVIQIQIEADSNTDYFQYGVCPMPSTQDAAQDTTQQTATGCSSKSKDGYGEFEPPQKLVVGLDSGNYTVVVRGCVSYYHSASKQDACGAWVAQDVVYDASKHNEDVKNALLLKNDLENKLVANCTADYIYAASYQGEGEPAFELLVQNFLNFGIDGCVQLAETGMLQEIENYASQEKDVNPFGVFILGASAQGLALAKYLMMQKHEVSADKAVGLGLVRRVGTVSPKTADVSPKMQLETMKGLSKNELLAHQTRLQAEIALINLQSTVNQGGGPTINEEVRKNWDKYPEAVTQLFQKEDGAPKPEFAGKIKEEFNKAVAGGSPAESESRLEQLNKELEVVQTKLLGMKLGNPLPHQMPDLQSVTLHPDDVAGRALGFSDGRTVHLAGAQAAYPETYSRPHSEARPSLLAEERMHFLIDSPQKTLLSQMSRLYSQLLDLSEAIVKLNLFLQ